MKNTAKTLRTIGLHVLGWLLFIILSGPLLVEKEGINPQREFLLLGSNLLQFMILLYPSVYYAIPVFLHKRRIRAYVGFSLVLVLLGAMLDLVPAILLEGADLMVDVSINDEALAEQLYYQNPHFPSYALVVYTGIYLFMNTWLLVGISALKLVYDTLRNRYELEVMTREKLRSELKFLREQNNPHFLFNNLNSLYVMIEESPATAQQMLLKLSNMLRYQLYDASSDRIPLQKEFDYIQDYIALQQLRYSEALEIDTDFGTIPESCTIEPYLLFTLVENAFKHGLDAESEAPYLTIQAQYEAPWLTFAVTNPVNTGHQADEEQKGGFGLKNLQKRLDLLYPHAHDYQVAQGEGYYRSTLKLQLACP